MLTLTEAQWQTLQQGEARQFVAAVCDEFLANRPEMREQPGREVVLVRMQDAYDRMQACIEAVEADITECQTLLGTLH